MSGGSEAVVTARLHAPEGLATERVGARTWRHTADRAAWLAWAEGATPESERGMLGELARQSPAGPVAVREERTAGGAAWRLDGAEGTGRADG